MSKPDKIISEIREKLLHKKQTILPTIPASKSNIYMNPYKGFNQWFNS